MLMTRGRTAALLVGLPLVFGVGGWQAFTMVGIFAQSSEHHETTYSFGGGEISIELDSGSVQVSSGAAGAVRVAYTSHYQLEKPKLSAATDDGGVRLRADCPGGLLSNNCAVNYTLTVPANAALVVHTGDGSVRVSDLTGRVSADSGNGSITLDRVAGAVDAHSGNGSIRASSLRSTSVQAKTGNGRIQLTWASAPTHVTATSDTGSITLTVPTGSGPYDVDASTGNGSRHVSVPIATGAPSSIKAHTGNGSVTVQADVLTAL